MTFWVVLRAPSMLRFVQPVIEALARSGHRVHVSFALREGGRGGSGTGHLAGLANVEISQLALERPGGAWAAVTRAALQPVRDLASYSTFRSRWGPLMRARWLEYFPRWIGLAIRLLDRLGLGRVIQSRPLRALSRMLATNWPVPSAMRRQLAALDPDVVVVSPMIYSGSREVDALRAARAAGIPSVGLVLSWDNLTSKGSFHARPDSLIVWNEAQAREAVDWHGFREEEIEALGAPVFDYLFARDGIPSREVVLARLGLPQDACYVIYAVSSRLGLGGGGEVSIARELARAIRGLNRSGTAPVVVVRPHPRNVDGWAQVEEPGLVVWGRPGFPISGRAKDDLLASVAHADAVVGLNTSFFIDAAIVGTPAIALLLQRTEQTPSQIIHFEHLVRADFLYAVDGPTEAAEVVNELRRNGDSRSAQRQAFVESFVRPRGLDRPAAEIVAERLASIRA